jgi:hypothetical protein
MHSGYRLLPRWMARHFWLDLESGGIDRAVSPAPCQEVQSRRKWQSRRGGSPDTWSCRICYTLKFWDSCALPNTSKSPLASCGDYSQALKAEISLKGDRPGKDSGEGNTIQHVFATIRVKSEAHGCSILVDFSKKSF